MWLEVRLLIDGKAFDEPSHASDRRPVVSDARQRVGGSRQGEPATSVSRISYATNGDMHSKPVTAIASRRVLVPRGANGSGVLAIQLRSCLSLPSGSSARSALQRALKRKGAGAQLGFFLFVASDESTASIERRPIGASHLSLSELIFVQRHGKGGPSQMDAATPDAANAPVSSTAFADSAPLQLQLRDERDELVGSLAADVDGLDALRALAMDRNAAEGRQMLQEALSQAACRGDPHALRNCLQRGADMNERDAWGQTALHWAASAPTPSEGQPSAVDTCLTFGAPANQKNIVGMTPLHWASAWGRLPAAKALLQAGAASDALDVQSKTPAAYAHLLREKVDSENAWRQKMTSREDEVSPLETRLNMLAELVGSREAAARSIQHRVRNRREGGMAIQPRRSSGTGRNVRLPRQSRQQERLRSV